MTNNQFYAFCRDNRAKEQDPEKRAVLVDVYHYMREVGVSRNGVNNYIATRLRQQTPALSQETKQAYEWLREVFDKPVPMQVPEGQGTLL